MYYKRKITVKIGLYILIFILLLFIAGCQAVPQTKNEATATEVAVTAIISSTFLPTTDTPEALETSLTPDTSTQSEDTSLLTPDTSTQSEDTSLLTPDTSTQSEDTSLLTPDIPSLTENDKNLFDGYMEEGGIDANGRDIDEENVLRTGYIEVNPNTVYTLSTVQIGDPFVTGGIVEYDENMNYICQTLSGGKVFPYTFITRGETKYIRWQTTKSIYSVVENIDYAGYWLEEGDISAPWTELLKVLKRDVPKSKGVENVLKRMSYFCDTYFITGGEGMVIGYTDPLKIGKPNPYTAVYLDKSSLIRGMPYSSLRKTDSYVGFEVSLDTYMTALYNPASIMYTENLQNPECDGYSNFIFYAWNPYGAVCSTVIGYSLGLDIRYSTYELSDVEGMDRVDMSEGEIQLGDLLCNVTSKDISGGHMAMVTDIIRNENGDILYVRITEAGIPTMAHSYVFYNYFKNVYLSDYSVYRYRYIDSVPEAYNGYIEGRDEYNTYIGLDRGDKSIYPIGSDVEINMLDLAVKTVEIELYSEEEAVYNKVFTSKDDSFKLKKIGDSEYTVCVYTPEICGKYRVCGITKEGERSEYLYFIVSDSGEIGFDLKDGQNIKSIKPDEELTVEFSGYSSCTPLYICIETNTYVTRSQRMLTEQEINEGRAVISYYGTGSCFVKIYYQNEFGRICSKRLAVEFK